MSDRSRFCWYSPDEIISHETGTRERYDPEKSMHVWTEAWIERHPNELGNISPTDRIVPDFDRFFAEDADKYPTWEQWQKDHGK